MSIAVSKFIELPFPVSLVKDLSLDARSLLAMKYGKPIDRAYDTKELTYVDDNFVIYDSRGPLERVVEGSDMFFQRKRRRYTKAKDAPKSRGIVEIARALGSQKETIVQVLKTAVLNGVDLNFIKRGANTYFQLTDEQIQAYEKFSKKYANEKTLLRYMSAEEAYEFCENHERLVNKVRYSQYAKNLLNEKIKIGGIYYVKKNEELKFSMTRSRHLKSDQLKR